MSLFFSSIQGLSSQGSSSGSSQGGFDFGQISQLGGMLNGSSGGSSAPQSSSGGAGSSIGGLAGAGIGTLIMPGVGTAIGGFLGSSIGGLFGGGGVPDHERSDLQKIAATGNITEQQASAICGYEESHSPKNYDEICKQAAGDTSFLQQIWEKYNRDHTSSPIYPQQQSQAVNTQALNVPSLATPTYVANPAASQAAASTGSNTTTYALLGGGALMVAIILFLLLKK